ncbi:hypothetical protein D9M68_483170 [compost metagenome]
MQAAFLEPDFLLVGQVGGNGGIGNAQVLDIHFADYVADAPEDFLAADGAEPEADVQQAQHIEVIQAFGPFAVVAQLAGGVDTAHHRPHGTAGDAGDFVAACLDLLDHANVRVTPRTS